MYAEQNSRKDCIKNAVAEAAKSTAIESVSESVLI